jgi:hypothetical protein
MPLRSMLWKEYRECRVIAALALGALLLLGAFLILASDSLLRVHAHWGYESGFSQMARLPLLWPVGVVLYVFSLLLGAAFAIRQYAIPEVIGESGPQLHLPVRRGAHLWAKLSVCLAAFAALAVMWFTLFALAAVSGALRVHPQTATLFRGLLFPLFGFVAYVGTAITCLSDGEWYKDRLCGVFSAALLLAFSIVSPSIPTGVPLCMLAFGVMLVVLYHLFRTREV